MIRRWKMLAWKECRERRSTLLLGLALTATCLAVGLGSALVQRLRGERLERFPWEAIGWLYCLMMPLWVAMQTACGDMSDRTRVYNLALPVSRARASLIRLIGGAVALILPIVVVAAVGSLAEHLAALAHAGPERHDLWSDAGRSVLLLVVGAIGCYLQLAVLGIWARSENELALVGAVWTIALSFISVLAGPPTWSVLLLCLVPQGLASTAAFDLKGPDSGLTLIDGVTGSLGVTVILAALFVWRHGRSTPRLAGQAGFARAHAWLSGRARAARAWPTDHVSRSQREALAWLAMRQSLPLALAAIPVALVMTCMAVFDMRRGELRGAHPWTTLATVSAMATSTIGVLWASVVGAGSMADELDRRSADFWRTRPIPYWRLFTLKFVVGLAVVVLVLDGPVALSAGLPHEEGSGETLYTLGYLACLVPLHAVMFAVAVAWACSLRRLAVGAMAAFACFLVVLLAIAAVPWFEWLNPVTVYEELLRVRDSGGHLSVWKTGLPAILMLSVIATVASYFIAGYFLSTYQPRHSLGQRQTDPRFRPIRQLLLRRSA